jgi:methylated-DNA-[protein]-cysteine S-methyltransferase
MHAPVLLTEDLDSATGPITLVTDAGGKLRALDWHDNAARMRTMLARYWGPRVTLRPRPSPSAAAGALRAYFAGALASLDDLEVDTGGTPFQQVVWQALRRIPAGTTTSYAALAAAIGRPRAVRAVGLANGSNPVGIVVPCHRVIGTDGSLTGYGGGLARKRWLLDHEKGRRPKTAGSERVQRTG